MISFSWRSASDESLIAGQMGLDSRHHLARAERLCNIVVSTETQAADLVDIVFLCGDHDDRCVFRLSDLLADLKSIHSRQHQIQDKEVKLLLHRPLQTGFSIIFYLNLKTGQLQIILFQLCNTLLIFYDQIFCSFNSCYGFISLSLPDIFLRTKCISVPIPSLLVAQILPP